MRKIDSGKPLVEQIIQFSQAFGIDLTADALKSLSGEKKVVLFFDGFDEVDEDQKPRMIAGLELLLDTHDGLRAVISSRPGSGLEGSPRFRIFKLLELNEFELPLFITKIAPDVEFADKVIKAIRSSSTDIKELLKTPLMATLLVMTYRAEERIPDDLPEFYDSLFSTLFSRHDRTKPGMARKRASGLNDSSLRSILDAASFRLRVDQLVRFKQEVLERVLASSLEKLKIQCEPDTVLQDLKKIACVIVDDGDQLAFIHKSVIEYHAARYVKNRDDAAVATFYKRFIKGDWRAWAQELKFLSHIDSYRYSKHLIIPSYEKHLGVDQSKYVLAGRLISTWAATMVDRMTLGFSRKEGSNHYIRMNSGTDAFIVTRHLEASAHGIFFQPISENMEKVIPLSVAAKDRINRGNDAESDDLEVQIGALRAIEGWAGLASIENATGSVANAMLNEWTRAIEERRIGDSLSHELRDF